MQLVWVMARQRVIVGVQVSEAAMAAPRRRPTARRALWQASRQVTVNNTRALPAAVFLSSHQAAAAAAPSATTTATTIAAVSRSRKLAPGMQEIN